jgi:Fe-Mn family superoxide dismutase
MKTSKKNLKSSSSIPLPKKLNQKMEGKKSEAHSQKKGAERRRSGRSEVLDTFNNDKENNMYFLGELYRRFSFEYNGMKNHEIYFDSLSDGPKEINMESILYKKIVENFGSFAEFLEDFQTLALTRGVGWAALWYNSERDILMSSWIDEQHLGQLNNTTMILGIDMWEHAYVYDYSTSEKKKYVEAFFANLNWEKIETNLKNAIK